MPEFNQDQKSLHSTPHTNHRTNPMSRAGLLCLAVGLVLMSMIHLQGKLQNAVHFAGGLLLGMALVFLLRGLYQQRRSRSVAN